MRSIKIFFTLLLLVSVSTNKASKAAGTPDFPNWIKELHSSAVKTLQVEVSMSHTNLPDRLAEGKYFVFCLKGEGRLEKVADPCETMRQMFASSGWKHILEYDADGHGSSSFAYRKGNYLCNISVETDSSCDDEETGHVPSKFWFEIDCREK